MQVREFMTESVACCTRDTRLKDVARMMCETDCGAIPIMEGPDGSKPVGIVTDRDIACRVVAEGKNPSRMKAEQVMSSPCVTVSPDDSLDDCCRILEEHQLRRVLVVDDEGNCCGIVAQADIARRAPEHETAEVVRELSQPARI